MTHVTDSLVSVPKAACIFYAKTKDITTEGPRERLEDIMAWGNEEIKGLMTDRAAKVQHLKAFKE